MTAREIKIAKKILDHLHGLDGGQCHPIVIHAEIGGLSFCSTTEFDEVLGWLGEKKYADYVETEFKGRLWNGTSLGEAARRKM
jgi:hypothetical protein